MKLTRLVSALLVVIALALSGGCATQNPEEPIPGKSTGGGGY